jgi:hypothetical protein
MNGFQLVKIWATTLRSPASMSELRVASHPSLSIAGEGHPLSRARSQVPVDVSSIGSVAERSEMPSD